jgi:hypothetical protein
MLKKRIKKWDLDRNHKEADMLYSLRLALSREAQGKDTIFLIRGRVVTFDDIKQYFRRKRVHDLQSVMTDASAAAPTTRIDCRTPQPDMTAADEAIHGSESTIATKELNQYCSFNVRNFHPYSTAVALLDPNQVDHMMPLTSTLSQLDQLLHLGRNYYDAVFEKPDWRSKDNTFELGSLENFYHHMFDGQLLLGSSHVTEAFQQFDRAFDLIHHLLSQQTFLFLPYMYHMMLSSWHIHGQEVVSQLLDFVSQLARKCYPQLNLIPQSLMLLHPMSFEDRGESSKRVFQSILDRLRVKFESDIPDDFELLSDAICQTRANVAIEQSLGNYKLTSIAVWKLAKDADLLEQLSEHEHIPTGGKMRIMIGDILHCESHFAWHRSSLPEDFGFQKPHSPFLHDHSGPPRSHTPKKLPPRSHTPKQLRTRLGNKRPRMQTVGPKPQLLPRRGIR